MHVNTDGIHFATIKMDWFTFWHMKVKSNKILFNSRDRVTFAPLISNKTHDFIRLIEVHL